MNSKFILGLIASLISFNSYCQYFSSGNKNLVIKETSCKNNSLLPTLSGILINRGTEGSEGIINIKIYDSDNDIVFQRTEDYRVENENGTRLYFQIDVGNCISPYRYTLTLTECKLKRFPLKGCQ